MFPSIVSNQHAGYLIPMLINTRHYTLDAVVRFFISCDSVSISVLKLETFSPKHNFLKLWSLLYVFWLKFQKYTTAAAAAAVEVFEVIKPSEPGVIL